MSHIVRYVFRKRPLEERHFLGSLREAIVADRALACRHVDAVLHRDVVQGLVPAQGRQVVLQSELIG
jgi:hypothetical protein